MDLVTARQAVRETYFADESATVRERLAQTRLGPDSRARIAARATALVEKLRADPSSDLIESFLAEYGLSTDEGVALMCLAEAYLRVPDAPTLDALIRDKIGGANWSRHSGAAESMLINASTWALMLTGRVFREERELETRVVATLRRMVQRIGEPVVRTAVAQAMRVMGQQFVLGRTIEEAIERGQGMRENGYRYSYDMLGEAARTDADARRYARAYARAIAAISGHADSRFVHDNPGISVKLSALYPRYEYVQRERVMEELVPRLAALVVQARNANIGLNVDAEEADRLDLSMDVIEAVLRNRDLAGWDGFGMVVQAYSKQCLPLLEWIDTLAETLDRKLSVRLVKGAYWDGEVKNSQVLGLDAYPVFTRKNSTDVSYLAGARFLLDHTGRIYPQFATHNAASVAAVLEMSGDFDGYEFQRLHGMGEGLFELVRHQSKRHCRIYAPVGVHEDLLAYLVRRLLENGANSSFVNQLLDQDVPVATLVRDPVAATEAHGSLPHPHIPLPPKLYGDARRNSRGWNVNNPVTAAEIEAGMAAHRSRAWSAAPVVGGERLSGERAAVLNPADRRDRVGDVVNADRDAARRALTVAVDAFPAWRDRSVANRADILDRIGDGFERNAPELMALLTREAGKTRLDGVLEIREAVDFCRYYAAEAREKLADRARLGRGPFVCISPWNFPLAIYTGQIVAALVAGNTVVAKPAEQAALIGARAFELMIEAGVPPEVLAFVPGEGGTVGAALTADARVAGVCFTGSTDTAILIDRAMAATGNTRSPLIAETGGLNAMIVDSTALPEAAVRDIVASSFQSAGQRCSALRALFVQKDIRARLVEMLEGATMELAVGDPWQPSVDVGPVIDGAALGIIRSHCERFAASNRVMFRHPMKQVGAHGLFAPPTAIRLERFEEMEREIFGPVLHVLEFEANMIEQVVDRINASGYGLTLGIHSRLDDRVEALCERARVGNIYVNRNQIGAVVGVQPFGGEGLSGTGPKAGGPHYLNRFTRARAPRVAVPVGNGAAAAAKAATTTSPEKFCATAVVACVGWDGRSDRQRVLDDAVALIDPPLRAAARAALDAATPFFGAVDALPGPTGESNHLTLHGRGIALCLGGEGGAAVLAAQAVLALAAGNAVALGGPDGAAVAGAIAPALERAGLPPGLLAALEGDDGARQAAELPDLGVVVLEGDDRVASRVRRELAARAGRRVPLIALADGVDLFATERVVSIDTTASGGNATLLTLGEEGL